MKTVDAAKSEAVHIETKAVAAATAAGQEAMKAVSAAWRKRRSLRKAAVAEPEAMLEVSATGKRRARLRADDHHDHQVLKQCRLAEVHIVTSGLTDLVLANFSGNHATLYDPSINVINTDYFIEACINGGLSANKLVLSIT